MDKSGLGSSSVGSTNASKLDGNNSSEDEGDNNGGKFTYYTNLEELD